MPWENSDKQALKILSLKLHAVVTENTAVMENIK